MKNRLLLAMILLPLLSTGQNKLKLWYDQPNYSREVFSSAPDQVIIMKLKSDQPGKLDLMITTGSQLKIKTSAAAGIFSMSGNAPAHVDPSYYNSGKEPVVYGDSADCRGMRYTLLLKAINTGGKLTVLDSGIKVQGATEVLLFLATRVPDGVRPGRSISGPGCGTGTTLTAYSGTCSR